MPDNRSQSDKFKETARELGCDEDEARWDETVAKVVQQKPKEPHEPGPDND